MTDTEIMDPAEIEQHADAQNQRDEAAQALTEQVQADMDATVIKPKREKKAVEPHPCRCASFEYGEETEAADGTPDRTIFKIDCDKTTQRVFAQGHDARLVSTLVSAQMDGYVVWQAEGGILRTFPDAVAACASVSEALGEKARKALANGLARRNGAAERQAARDNLKAERLAAKVKAKAEKAAAKEAAATAKAAANPTARSKDVPPVELNGPRDVPVNVISGDAPSGEVDGSGGPTELEEGESVVTIKVGRNEIQATLSADGKTVSWRNAQGEYKERPADTVRILTEA